MQMTGAGLLPPPSIAPELAGVSVQRSFFEAAPWPDRANGKGSAAREEAGEKGRRAGGRAGTLERRARQRAEGAALWRLHDGDGEPDLLRSGRGAILLITASCRRGES